MVNHLRGILVVAFFLIALPVLVQTTVATMTIISGPGTWLSIHEDDYPTDELIVRFRPEISGDANKLGEVAGRIHALIGAVIKRDLSKDGLKGV